MSETYDIYYNCIWDDVSTTDIEEMKDSHFYLCGGGGPEWGYVIKGDLIWEVERSWFQYWTIKKLKNKEFILKDNEITICDK